MIPRTIQIKNFLSYGTDGAPISFEGHSLICLSGNNGHGKSALLDAITWAIWGCARKIQNSVRADQGLLRLNQTTMLVIFDCIIQNIPYRIKREFELVYGKPKTTLEFGILSDDETIQSLTEKTIRDTQARINTIIGLDYETFINSSFLRQGNANEFSKRSPKERKEIISTILGLNVYDTLKRAALEKGRVATQDVASIETLITHTLTEKESLTTLLSAYPQFQSALAELSHEIAACTARKKQLHDALVTHEDDKQKLCIAQHEHKIRLARYTQSVQELTMLVQHWRTTRACTADVQEYNRLQQKISTAKATQTALQATFTVYHRIKDQLQTQEHHHTELRHAIATLTTQIQTDQKMVLEQLSTTHKQYTEQLTALTLQEKAVTEEIKTIEYILIENARTIQELAQKTNDALTRQKIFDKKKETYHRWTTLGNVLRDEQNVQLQRLQLTQDVDKPSCPLCEQSLSSARKRFLQTKIEEQISLHSNQLERFKRILPQLKNALVIEHAALQIIAEQKTALHTLEHARNQEELKITHCTAMLNTLREKKNDLTRKIHEVAAHKDALEVLALQKPSSPELITLETQLAHVTAALAETKSALNACAYNTHALEEINLQICMLQENLDLYENHMKAALLQQERAATITTLIQKLKQEKKCIKKEADLDQKLAACIHQVEMLCRKQAEMTTQEQILRTSHQNLLIEQGKYDAARAALCSAEKNGNDLEIRLQKARTIVSDYQSIATAVGKDGIQALLIEEAIPEIEEYANSLLSKLTNNTAHIMIESLRDLKSGGTKETLDIKISDTQGVRPYEMFSGGEAFRIDIALRIAISKLLAHRAGTALQTLIIDEGFGSQDEDGLNAMIDVLHTLQSEFAKIIVVSHLPMMKDQFPVHFVVEKGAQGSMVRVFEQG